MKVEFPNVPVGKDERGYFIEMPLDATGTMTDKVYVTEIFEEYAGKRISLTLDDPTVPVQPRYTGAEAERARAVMDQLGLAVIHHAIDDELNTYRYLDETYAAGPRPLSFSRAAPGTPEELVDWQAQVRATVRELLHFPYPDVDVKIEWGPTAEFGGVQMRKLYFWSQPNLKVPAVLSHPVGLSEPTPAVVCLHGHNQGQVCTLGFHHSSSDSYYGLELAQRGFVTLSMDVFGWGERVAVHKNRRYANSEHKYALSALLLAQNAIGIRAWEVSKALDVLSTLDVVDADNFGVIGQSGGGMVSAFSAAVEERLRAAVVSGYFCEWHDSIFVLNHCGCNFVPDLLAHLEIADMLGARAPKPCFIVSGEHDPIFPQPGVQKAYRKLQAIYEAAGHPENLGIDVLAQTGHKFSGREAYPWLARVLDLEA